MRRLLLLAPVFALLLAWPAAGQRPPRTAEQFYERGLERLRREDADGAIADFDKAVALRPDFADFYFARGLAWGVKEKGADFPEAQRAREAQTADLNTAVSLAPERAEFRKRRGVHMLRFAAGAEDYDAVIEDFGRAISSTPGDAQLYFLRASVLMLKDDFVGALPDFDRAVALAPAEPGYVGARAWLKLVFLADYAGAEADADAAVKLGGDSAYEWYATRGKARLALGKTREGAQDLRNCRRLDRRCAATLDRLEMLMGRPRRPPKKD